jgi:hypothetical protein
MHSSSSRYLKFISNPLTIVVLVLFLFISYYYHPIFFRPADFIFNDKGDAIKNYYCYQWHIMNDTSFVNFTGVNYPFGELHAYTDGMPILSNFIRVFSFLKPYSIPIFNLTLILSFFLCAILLVKIFQEFKLPKIHVVLASIGITLLCPQMLRLGGHLALSYSFFLPLIIYLMLLYEKGERGLFVTLLISFALTCFFFIHPYLGMIACSFLFVYWIVKFSLRGVQLKKTFLHFLLQSIVPMLYYFAYVKLTDSHINRPEEPYGFLFYTANIESIFISTMPPLRHFLSQIYKIKIQNWEGIAYVGTTTTIAFFYLLFLFFRKRELIKVKLKENVVLRTFFYFGISAVLLLLFSMGYPFKWNMESLLEYVSFVKQFRAPGRFAWVFFFVGTISSTVIISKFFFPQLPKNVRTIIGCLLIFFFLVEAVPFHNYYSKRWFVKNCFKYELVDPELKKVITAAQSRKAQSILPLPFFHIGTDKYDILGTDKIKSSVAIVSYHASLPIMAGFSPRTSLTETQELLQLISSDSKEKVIKKHLDPTRPFLVLYSKEPIGSGENLLLMKGNVILETPNYVLKEITFQQMFQD